MRPAIFLLLRDQPRPPVPGPVRTRTAFSPTVRLFCRTALEKAGSAATLATTTRTRQAHIQPINLCPPRPCPSQPRLGDARRRPHLGFRMGHDLVCRGRQLNVGATNTPKKAQATPFSPRDQSTRSPRAARAAGLALPCAPEKACHALPSSRNRLAITAFGPLQHEARPPHPCI